MEPRKAGISQLRTVCIKAVPLSHAWRGSDQGLRCLAIAAADGNAGAVGQDQFHPPIGALNP